MFVRIASPAIESVAREVVLHDLVQAAHVAGNLAIEPIGIENGVAVAQLKSFRPIDAHVQSRFVTAGSQRFGAFNVDFFDTAADAGLTV